MELTIFDRLMLLNILPEKGDITTIRIVRQLREDLSFSEDEHKALDFTQDEGRVMWKPEGDKPKDIDIGEKAKGAIVAAFEGLSEKEEFTPEHLATYEKFVTE